MAGTQNGTLGAEQIQAIVAASIAAYQAQAPLPQSSVELSVSAKGQVQPVVKVYGANPDENAATAARILDELLARYRAGVAATPPA